MDSLPLPIAKEEYTRQVENAVIPQIFKGFLDMFNEAIEETRNEGKTYEVLKRFQKFLKSIKKWNDTILKEATDSILKEVPSFKKLIVTILLGNITILTAIKLKGSDSNIKVKIPPMSVIVHRIYIESARTFYYKPELFLKPEEYTNRKEIHDIIREAVSEALSQCIPIDDILEETIGENYNNPELSGGLLNRSSEEEVSEDENSEIEEVSEEEIEDEIEDEDEEVSEEENENSENENSENENSENENSEIEENENEIEEVSENENSENENSGSTESLKSSPTVSSISKPPRLPFSFHTPHKNKFNIAKPQQRPHRGNMRSIPKLKLKVPSN